MNAPTERRPWRLSQVDVSMPYLNAFVTWPAGLEESLINHMPCGGQLGMTRYTPRFWLKWTCTIGIAKDRLVTSLAPWDFCLSVFITPLRIAILMVGIRLSSG